ncbi:hypothetical protein IWW57_006748, partial [Coemansia sp. S610]
TAEVAEVAEVVETAESAKIAEVVETGEVVETAETTEVAEHVEVADYTDVVEPIDWSNADVLFYHADVVGAIDRAVVVETIEGGYYRYVWRTSFGPAEPTVLVAPYTVPPVLQGILAAYFNALATASAARWLGLEIDYAQLSLGSRLYDRVKWDVVRLEGRLMVAMAKESNFARHEASSARYYTIIDTLPVDAVTEETIAACGRARDVCNFAFHNPSSLDSYKLAIKKVEEGADRRAAIWRAISDDIAKRIVERTAALMGWTR